mmetsp:Transcript_78740/g.227684  ORF Transcript_78740/g.227684 Transcript_78740/m.227684 type:complete len:225 (+) Transcript_78740:811-1485(+)
MTFCSRLRRTCSRIWRGFWSAPTYIRVWPPAGVVAWSCRHPSSPRRAPRMFPTRRAAARGSPETRAVHRALTARRRGAMRETLSATTLASARIGASAARTLSADTASGRLIRKMVWSRSRSHVSTGTGAGGGTFSAASAISRVTLSTECERAAVSVFCADAVALRSASSRSRRAMRSSCSPSRFPCSRSSCCSGAIDATTTFSTFATVVCDSAAKSLVTLATCN